MNDRQELHLEVRSVHDPASRKDPRRPYLVPDWYRTCLECLAELEHHADHHRDLPRAFAHWCRLCAAAAEAINGDEVAQADHVEYLNGTPIARWFLSRLKRLLW